MRRKEILILLRTEKKNSIVDWNRGFLERGGRKNAKGEKDSVSTENRYYSGNQELRQ